MRYEDCILFVLAKANQRVHRVFKPMFQRYGLTPMQALVLNALYIDEGLSAGELGKRLMLDSATLSGVLERMVEGGWIVKITTDEDRRVVNLHVTNKANKIKDELLKEVEAIHDGVLSSFRLEEKLLFDRMLRDLWK
jgi:DNA-binding MarR family transcriptional regulator